MPKFRTAYSEIKRLGLDYSNPYEDVYEEIPPYAVDLETGELINKTRNPILKKVGVRNVQEAIQSYAQDVDIYKILERVAISGDSSLLNRRVGYFGDFVNLPDNLNDFNEFVKKAFNENSSVSKDIIEAAANLTLGSGELNALIEKHVKQALIAANNNQVVEENK